MVKACPGSTTHCAPRFPRPPPRAKQKTAPPEGEPKPIRIAIVGRPNTGKSTLINRLVGQERLLTSPEAGTTRDAIAVDFEWRGRRLPHLRHCRPAPPFAHRREARKLAAADARDAVRFAEVVIVLIDAEGPFVEQDIRIADLVEQEGRAIVIAVSIKSTSCPRQAECSARGCATDADRLLPQIKGVPPCAGVRVHR